MNYYNVTKVFHDMAPLNNILLQKKIIDAIKKYGGGKLLKNRGFKVDPTEDPIAPLNRLNEMLKLFEHGTKLPPVEVNIRYINNVPFYSIVNGRHRFAAAVLNGHTHLPIQIVGTF